MGSLLPTRTSKPGKGANIFRSFLGQRIGLAVALVVLMSTVLLINPAPPGIELGKPAPRTYRAARQVQFIDQAATDEARQVAFSSVDPVYIKDASAASTSRSEISDFFAAVKSARAAYSGETTLTAEQVKAARIAQVSEVWSEDIPEEVIAIAVGMTESELSAADAQARELVTLMMAGTLLPADIEAARVQLATNADLLAVPRAQRRVVSAVGQAALLPNLKLDEDATTAAREVARDGVEPVIVAKQAGENIVVQGQIVTAEQLELLSVLGVFDNSTDWPALAASIALLAAMVGASGAYLALYEERVWSRRRDLLILSTLLLGTVAATRVIVWLYPEVSPYVLPYPLVAMLVTILVNARVGLLAAIMTTVAGSLLGLSSGVYVVAVLIVNLLAVVAMTRLKERAHLFYAGAFVMASMALIAMGATIASTSSFAQGLADAGYGLIGGLLAAVLTYGLLPFFEVVFQVTTDVRLLELANPSHPLMKQLMMQAPGTYNHSVLTANLAEAAAEEVGANPLLARVGAYYHDIGKVRRPMFFVENQMGIENPHDETSPTLSSLIITAHVKEGLELAKEHKLPEEIQDIIVQHHGTSLVSYFYRKATDAGADVQEAEFRYSGERPKTPEAALVMLADAAEAAARTVAEPTVDHMEQVVRRVARDKLEDGQLDESDLTLSDLDAIVKQYARMLAGVYHKRVRYPDAPAGGAASVEPKATADVRMRYQEGWDARKRD